MVTSQLGLSSSSGFKMVVERLQWREDLSPRQVSGIICNYFSVNDDNDIGFILNTLYK